MYATFKYGTLSISILLLTCITVLILPETYAQPDEQKIIDSLKKQLQSATADTQRVNLLLTLSMSVLCKERLPYAQEALSMAEQIRWKNGIYLSLARIIDVQLYCLNMHTETIVYAKRLQKIASEDNNSEYLTAAYSALAKIYKELGQSGKAIEYYNKTVQLNLGIGSVLSTLGNMGQVYYNLGDYEHAVVTYERALKLLNDTIVADKSIPEGYIMMQAGLKITVADIYVRMRDHDRALQNYQEALAISKRISNTEMVKCWAINGIGNCYVQKKEIDKGIPYFEEALTIAQSIENESVVPEEDILNAIATAFYTKGEMVLALKYCQQSISTAIEKKNSLQLSASYTTLGKIFTHKGKYADAVKYLKKSVELSKAAGARDNEKNAWGALSEAYAAMHKTDKAFDAYKNFISLRDSLYNADKAKELTRLTMQGEFDRQQVADSVAQADADKLTALKLQRQRTLTYTGFGAVALALVLAFFIYRNYANAKKANIVIRKAHKTIQDEKQVSENLLLNILPEHVADELKAKGDVQAKRFENVTILFTDFVSFTTVSERLSPEGLVAELHACFKVFDEITARYGIEKIKTVGDAYLAAAGLPSPDPDHAEHVVLAAIEIRDFMAQRKKELGDDSFNIRVGINTGTVVAGIVGVKKFAYDIWGDAVNTAARMEQNSEAGKINISHNTYEIVKEKFACTYRGEHEAKNKGMLKMYFVEKLI